MTNQDTTPACAFCNTNAHTYLTCPYRLNQDTTEPEQWAVEQHIKKNPKCEWLCNHTKLENLGEEKLHQDTTSIDDEIDNIIVRHNQYIDAVWQGKHQMYALPETHQQIKALISDQVAKAAGLAWDVSGEGWNAEYTGVDYDVRELVIKSVLEELNGVPL